MLAEDGINVRGIYERSDAKVREKEGLERTKGFLSEPFDTNVLITENGIRYYVDVENGQKTGFFLDQKENRRAIRRLCPGADVLDCFTHTGSFGLNAAQAGAEHVLSVDSSDTAIDQARNLNFSRSSNHRERSTTSSFSTRPLLPSPGLPSRRQSAVTARSISAV